MGLTVLEKPICIYIHFTFMESHRGLKSQDGLPTWDEPKIIEYHSSEIRLVLTAI
jgi:hypothetical protein